jgi:hypothetical protein
MHTTKTKSAARRRTCATRGVVVLVIASLSFGSYFGTIGADRAVAAVAPGTPSGRASGPQQEQIAAIKGIARDAMKQYDLKSIIMRVTSGGKNVYTEALGESMTGVPATPAMHFRNGAMAFTYMATLLMELVSPSNRWRRRLARTSSASATQIQSVPCAIRTVRRSTMASAS